MECKQVWGVYWSATGNTRRVVERLAAGLADGLGQGCRMVDLTPQNARAQPRQFRAGDLVVVGLPTYAGKLPNKILPDVRTKLRGGGALAVGVVTFGNRSFDNALAELCVTLETDGFHTVAAAAFVGRHAFTDRLAAGRPDGDDLRQADAFARCVAERVRALAAPPPRRPCPGTPPLPITCPRGRTASRPSFSRPSHRPIRAGAAAAGSVPGSVPWGPLTRPTSRRSRGPASSARPACAAAPAEPNTLTTRPFGPMWPCWSRIFPNPRKTAFSCSGRRPRGCGGAAPCGEGCQALCGSFFDKLSQSRGLPPPALSVLWGWRRKAGRGPAFRQACV